MDHFTAPCSLEQQQEYAGGRRTGPPWPLVVVPRGRALSALVVTTGLVAPASFAAAGSAPTVTDGCISSVGDPDTPGPVKICYTMYRPAEEASKQVPVLLEGHGWGGSRTTDPAVFAPYLSHGYGVISFDQRGFGDSGGKAQTMDPDVEGVDVQRLIDLAAAQSWVRKDRPGDPRIGAIGGSYGGGYQYVGAFSEIANRGAPASTPWRRSTPGSTSTRRSRRRGWRAASG